MLVGVPPNESFGNFDVGFVIKTKNFEMPAPSKKTFWIIWGQASELAPGPSQSRMTHFGSGGDYMGTTSLTGLSHPLRGRRIPKYYV